MKPSTEFKIFKLCKGMTIAQVEKRVELMRAYTAQRQAELRVKLYGLTLGD